MGQFTLALNKFAEAAGERADATVRTVVLDIGAELISRSPVDTGRFRSNWNYSLNAPVGETTEQTGVHTLNHLDELPKAAASATHFIQNNLPYAQRLEEGHSKQAPLGMVSLTLQRFQSIVDDAAARRAGLDSLGVLGIE